MNNNINNLDYQLNIPIPISEQKWTEDNLIFVSVKTFTYNHQDFIKECIEGILIQKTTFPVELIIHDDASTDKTAEIIREYELKYPQIIKAIYQKENKYSNQNIGNIIKEINFACNGKYIALCDGDDFWTDPLKLQKQVEFMEKNNEFVLCFHKVFIKNNDELLDDNITKIPDNHENLLDLATFGNYIHTPSVLFKNTISEFPPDFYTSPIGDYPLYIYLSQFGKLKYFNEQMAVYRFGVGIWSNQSQYYKDYLTAKCHTILFEYFRLKDNFEIAFIFANRILNFLRLNTDKISDEETEKLLKNDILNKYFINQLLHLSDSIKKFNYQENYYAQLFYKNKNSEFQEKQSLVKNISLNINKISFLFEQPLIADQLRFDPLNDYVNIDIKSIHIFHKERLIDIEINLSSNASYSENNIFIFETSDPQIFINFPNQKTIEFDKIIIETEYQYNANNLIIKVLKQNRIKNELNLKLKDDELNKMNEILYQTNKELKQKTYELNQIFASRFWQITKPLRLLVKLSFLNKYYFK